MDETWKEVPSNDLQLFLLTNRSSSQNTDSLGEGICCTDLNVDGAYFFNPTQGPLPTQDAGESLECSLQDSGMILEDLVSKTQSRSCKMDGWAVADDCRSWVK